MANDYFLPPDTVDNSVSHPELQICTYVRYSSVRPQLLSRLGAAHTDLSFAERKGAALGLAGVIKGLKIAALKKHNVMTALTALVETKGQPGARQVRGSKTEMKNVNTMRQR